jgi:hypothetical protein
MVKIKVVGWKHGAHTPVQIEMNARIWLKMMKKRIALCHAVIGQM